MKPVCEMPFIFVLDYVYVCMRYTTRKNVWDAEKNCIEEKCVIVYNFVRLTLNPVILGNKAYFQCFTSQGVLNSLNSNYWVERLLNRTAILRT